jgi:hypothetical protein
MVTLPALTNFDRANKITPTSASTVAVNITTPSKTVESNMMAPS